MSKVLIVVAHADDEIIGCGATIAKHIKNGDDVYLLVMTDGVSSREESFSQEKLVRNNALEKSCLFLGIKEYFCEDFPDNALDSVPLLCLTKAVERVIDKVQPTTIYTHFYGDLNIDHKLTNQAVITATRPQPDNCVKTVLCFEIQSSTEWGFNHQQAFTPNYFVDVSEFKETKKKLLTIYQDEMREPPHSRSINNILNNLSMRGAIVGCDFAEAFVVSRILE